MQQNQHIAELGPLMERRGIRHVVIAPGSRNAPLIQLFTSTPVFRCHSIVDERSAAYVALGMAKELREPVAVVTTSGTAVMNLAPATAEAFFQNIPLVLLTADRPAEPVRQFNNQRIDQVAPFYNHTKGFYEMPLEPRTGEEVTGALQAVEALLKESVEHPPGPVHINIPLLEPLYEPLPAPVFSDKILSSPSDEGFDPSTVVPSEIRSHGKILVLAGMEEYDQEAISTLSAWCGSAPVAVVAENLSNIPPGWAIGNPEPVLAGASEEELLALRPDLVIGMGGQQVSKRLKHFIQNSTGIDLLQVEGDPSTWIRQNLAGVKEGSGGTGENSGTGGINPYLKVWKQLESRQMQKMKGAMEEAPFSNLTVVGEVLRRVPAGSVVHLGNSSTVRYSQFLTTRSDLVYRANRGTSGIDGSVSAAAGSAMVSGRQHLLVVGDLSFVYDCHALWNRNFPDNLRIVVINDGGGGIFRLLDGPDRMPFFEEYSVTHHPVSIELLAQAYGHGFLRASGPEELESALGALFSREPAAKVLEVDTTGSENSFIFKAFIKKISSK